MKPAIDIVEYSKIQIVKQFESFFNELQHVPENRGRNRYLEIETGLSFYVNGPRKLFVFDKKKKTPQIPDKEFACLLWVGEFKCSRRNTRKRDINKYFEIS